MGDWTPLISRKEIMGLYALCLVIPRANHYRMMTWKGLSLGQSRSLLLLSGSILIDHFAAFIAAESSGKPSIPPPTEA